MNAIIDPAGLVSSSHRHTHADHHEQEEEAATYTLRRTGRKAVKFEGWQLIEAIGSQENRDVWHDLNVYCTVKDALVVELIVRHASADHLDMFRVKTFDDVADAAAWLEGYRPAEDAPIPLGLGTTDTAEIAFLKARIQHLELVLETARSLMGSNHERLLRRLHEVPREIVELSAQLRRIDPGSTW